MRERGLLALGLSILLVLVYLVPTLHVILLSVGLLNVPASAVAPNLESFRQILDEPRILPALRASAAIALAAALVATLVTGLGLSAVSGLSRRGRGAVLALLLLPLFVPETAHALALLHALVAVGLSKGTLAVVLALVVFSLPVAGVVLFLGLVRLDDGVGAACLDMGLGAAARVGRVYLPLMWPSIAMSVVLCFFIALNESTRTSYCEAREMYSVYLRGQLAGGGGDAVYAVSTLLLLSGVSALLLVKAAVRRPRES